MKFISCKEDSYFLQFVLFTGDLAGKCISCSINMSNIQSSDDLQFIEDVIKELKIISHLMRNKMRTKTIIINTSNLFWKRK